MLHFIAHVLGFGNGEGNGSWYLLWSGIFGDVAIFAAAGAFLRHRNCHAPWCLRVGRHELEGTPYRVCRRHHPTLSTQQPSLERMHHEHFAHLDRIGRRR